MSTKTLNRLLEWGVAHGVTLPEGIEFIYDDKKGICCVTTDEIQNPSIKVPADIIISGKLAKEVFIDVTEHNSNTYLKFLLARLMFDKNLENNSKINDLAKKFGPYLNALPLVIDSPLIWNPVELMSLNNTNLGNSINEKLKTIYKEWYEIVKGSSEFDNDNIINDLKIFKKYDTVSYNEIYDSILINVSSENHPIWYSFSSFLWAHLVFISRAFPEYVVNRDCLQSAVVLLPVVDLLNHDYNTKVEWLSDNGAFCYRNLNTVPAGVELNNNYGGKGNEELLSGYGFVINNNLFDSVALKIKLPLEVIGTILKEEPELKLPTLSEYTWFAFDSTISNGKIEDDKSLSNFKDGIIFFINTNNEDCLTPLIDLFSYLAKTSIETWTQLRPQFEGLQMLRNALDHKLKSINIAKTLIGEELFEKYPVKQYRNDWAETYRNGQIQILNHSISTLKELEKKWMASNKSKLLTMNKVLKYDPEFSKSELSQLFEGQDQDDVVFESTFELFTLWFLTKSKQDSFPQKYSWVKSQLEEFINLNDVDSEISEDAQEFFNGVLHQNSKLSLEDVNRTIEFLKCNSFTRVSSLQETIIVRI